MPFPHLMNPQKVIRAQRGPQIRYLLREAQKFIWFVLNRGKALHPGPAHLLSDIFSRAEPLPPPLFSKEMKDHSRGAQTQAQGRCVRHHKAVVLP
jgi:hypothetical protein